MATSLKQISSDIAVAHVNKINYDMSYIDDLKISAADCRASISSYPHVAYDLSPEAKSLLQKFIDDRVEELKS